MKRGIEDLQLQIAPKRAGVENMARAGAPRRGFRFMRAANARASSRRGQLATKRSACIRSKTTLITANVVQRVWRSRNAECCVPAAEKEIQASSRVHAQNSGQRASFTETSVTGGEAICKIGRRVTLCGIARTWIADVAP